MPTARIPGWTRDVDRALSAAVREAPLLACATPRGGASRAELVRAFEAGAARTPDWTYACLDGRRAAEVARGLEALAAHVEGCEPAALGAAYAARARELALEVRLSSEVGGAGFAALARERFPPRHGEHERAAALSTSWASEVEEEPAERLPSDAEDPRSLVARVREEVGRKRLPFRVVVSSTLTALAATGDRTIWVAAGRLTSIEDVERTVVHEIEGHAVPRARASLLPLGLFAIGTARGVDDQEGYALVVEDRGGFLRGARRRELAARHRVVLAMDDGASFVEAVRALVEQGGEPVTRAVAAAERAFRGSSGEGPGLGRERIYLEAYVRTREHLARSPEDEQVVASGQVAVEAARELRDFAVDPTRLRSA